MLELNIEGLVTLDGKGVAGADVELRMNGVTFFTTQTASMGDFNAKCDGAEGAVLTCKVTKGDLKGDCEVRVTAVLAPLRIDLTRPPPPPPPPPPPLPWKLVAAVLGVVVLVLMIIVGARSCKGGQGPTVEDKPPAGDLPDVDEKEQQQPPPVADGGQPKLDPRAVAVNLKLSGWIVRVISTNRRSVNECRERIEALDATPSRKDYVRGTPWHRIRGSESCLKELMERLIRKALSSPLTASDKEKALLAGCAEILDNIESLSIVSKGVVDRDALKAIYDEINNKASCLTIEDIAPRAPK